MATLNIKGLPDALHRKLQARARRARPFSRLDRRDRDTNLLQSLFVVRNAIAHQSGAARRDFENLPVAGMAAGRRRPSDYLTQVVGNVTRHEIFCCEVLRIGRALSVHSESAARRYLLPERVYRAGDNVPRGRYQCSACRTMAVVNTARAVLPNCNACPHRICQACGRKDKSTFERA